jgi:hypothetical protein
MNQKDLKKLRLFIDKGAHNVMVSRAEPNGEISNLQEPITDQFLQCMMHYLLTKSNDGKIPVVMKANNIPVYEIRISTVKADHPSPAAGSLISRP